MPGHHSLDCVLVARQLDRLMEKELRVPALKILSFLMMTTPVNTGLRRRPNSTTVSADESQSLAEHQPSYVSCL